MSNSPLPVVPGTLEPAGQLAPGATFYCTTLHGSMPVGCCLLRQSANRRQRTRDTWRGQAPMFPSCSSGCSQGAAVREAVVGAELVYWRGAGPGGRFEPGRRGQIDQVAARKRLQLVGLLDHPPCLDSPPCDEIATALPPGTDTA